MTQTKLTKVAFIGLGNMGFPMAGHLQEAGYDVTVYNRTPSKADAWAKQYGGKSALTPREAAQDAEFVMMCVGNDNDVRSVVYGEDGVLAGIAKGGVLIDHTTTSAILAEELYAKAKEAGVNFMDAPVSGGQSGAQKGVLTVFVGGEPDVYERALPLLKTYGQLVTLFGPAGTAQRVKMVNQICVAGAVQALSEAIAFGINAGLPMESVMHAVSLGAGGSWQMQNRSGTMIENRYDFGFALDWMRKDLGIALEEAHRNGSALPVTAVIDQFFAELQAKGCGRWDTSALVYRLPRKDLKDKS
ncbi:MAG: NAD(P)-dependent oxidoreductase [Sutterella sp.]|nr:NAD(P)-dependent oxidoreductase [Sutterella sp.]